MKLETLSPWTSLLCGLLVDSWKAMVKRETPTGTIEALFLMMQLLALFGLRIKLLLELEILSLPNKLLKIGYESWLGLKLSISTVIMACSL